MYLWDHAIEALSYSAIEYYVAITVTHGTIRRVRELYRAVTWGSYWPA